MLYGPERFDSVKKGTPMDRSFLKTSLDRIYENLSFLTEAFSELEDKDIPNVPFLELARCFDLSSVNKGPLSRRRGKRRPSS
jgi:hypothetical protein